MPFLADCGIIDYGTVLSDCVISRSSADERLIGMASTCLSLQSCGPDGAAGGFPFTCL